jgi:hypothetical protein
MTVAVQSERITSRNVGVAAEAIAAAQFARIGFDISVQYGANQPEYDLAIVQGDTLMKVSVKGSQDGGWGLSQSYLKDADYHKAADDWLGKHGRETVLCFVQFQGVGIEEMPRLYLAQAHEVAAVLKATRNGLGDTIIHERKAWVRGAAAGSESSIPADWRFSKLRVDEILSRREPGASSK